MSKRPSQKWRLSENWRKPDNVPPPGNNDSGAEFSFDDVFIDSNDVRASTPAQSSNMGQSVHPISQQSEPNRGQQQARRHKGHRKEKSTTVARATGSSVTELAGTSPFIPGSFPDEEPQEQTELCDETCDQRLGDRRGQTLTPGSPWPPNNESTPQQNVHGNGKAADQADSLVPKGRIYARANTETPADPSKKPSFPVRNRSSSMAAIGRLSPASILYNHPAHSAESWRRPIAPSTVQIVGSGSTVDEGADSSSRATDRYEESSSAIRSAPIPIPNAGAGRSGYGNPQQDFDWNEQMHLQETGYGHDPILRPRRPGKEGNGDSNGADGEGSGEENDRGNSVWGGSFK